MIWMKWISISLLAIVGSRNEKDSYLGWHWSLSKVFIISNWQYYIWLKQLFEVLKFAAVHARVHVIALFIQNNCGFANLKESKEPGKSGRWRQNLCKLLQMDKKKYGFNDYHIYWCRYHTQSHYTRHWQTKYRSWVHQMRYHIHRCINCLPIKTYIL